MQWQSLGLQFWQPYMERGGRSGGSLSGFGETGFAEKARNEGVEIHVVARMPHHFLDQGAADVQSLQIFPHTDTTQQRASPEILEFGGGNHLVAEPLQPRNRRGPWPGTRAQERPSAFRCRRNRAAPPGECALAAGRRS